MKSSAQTKRSGFTIIEVIVALAVILVIVIGALSFQYYCAADTREADVRAGANRLALLMLEGWRGSGGQVPPSTAGFDPVAEFGSLVPISTTSIGLAGVGPELGKYKIVANRANYFVTLSYNDTVDPTLRTLGVTVAWGRNYKAEELDEYVRSVALTTLVEN